MTLVCKGLRPDQKNGVKEPQSMYRRMTEIASYWFSNGRFRGNVGRGGGGTLISLQSNLNDCNS